MSRVYLIFIFMATFLPLLLFNTQVLAQAEDSQEESAENAEAPEEKNEVIEESEAELSSQESVADSSAETDNEQGEKEDFDYTSEFDDDLDSGESEEDSNVKIVYRTPKSCKEFSLYLDSKALRLKNREKQIKKMEKMIAKMQKDFEIITEKYVTAEEKIKKLIHHDPSNLKDNPELARIIKLYESLSAEEAAIRLKNLDLDLTLAVLKGMKPKKLSQIMTALEPKIAAALSSHMVRGF